jgi:hypothetical protein
MEAKELRIGNWVYTGKLVVKSYSPSGLCNLMRNIEDEDSDITPIPLTEEWLLKFGFKKGTIENDNWAFTVFFYDIWRVIYKEKKGYGSADVYLENFWSVHQLQNLYFALTNKEL